MWKRLKLLIILLAILLSAYFLGFPFSWLHSFIEVFLQEDDTSFPIVDNPANTLSETESSINNTSVKPLDDIQTPHSTDTEKSFDHTEKESGISFKKILLIITSNSLMAFFLYFCSSIILSELMELDPEIIDAVLGFRRDNPPPREAA